MSVKLNMATSLHEGAANQLDLLIRAGNASTALQKQRSHSGHCVCLCVFLTLFVAGAFEKLAEGILQEVDHLGSVRCVKPAWRLRVWFYNMCFLMHLFVLQVSEKCAEVV